MGLEEVFESTNAGQTWVAASPYWNYPFACDATNTCPITTHPDQHAMMITDGKIVIGNDGGVYSRPLSDDAEDGNWTDLNTTLHDLQFYDARAGQLSDGTTQVVGGMQDNGTMVDDTAFTQSAEAAGGDGFDVIVDPANANNWVGEYTYGALYTTTDGGHSFSRLRQLHLRRPGDGRPDAERELRPESTVRHAARPGPAEPQHLDRRRRGRVGLHERLEHVLRHRGDL